MVARDEEDGHGEEHKEVMVAGGAVSMLGTTGAFREMGVCALSEEGLEEGFDWLVVEARKAVADLGR